MENYYEEMSEIAEKFSLDPDEIEVDFKQLDVEWARDNTIMDKYLSAAAYASMVQKKADEKVKTLRSELILKVNLDPAGCLGSGQKATAPNVEAYYRTNEGYKEAKEECIRAAYICDLVHGQKSKAYARKTILQEAAKLSLAGWFSSPLVPKELNELVSKIDEAKEAMLNKKIKEKRTPRRRRV